jgi:hypothetical protein
MKQLVPYFIYRVFHFSTFLPCFLHFHFPLPDRYRTVTHPRFIRVMIIWYRAHATVRTVAITYEFYQWSPSVSGVPYFVSTIE